jgi:hypothetical protein
MVAKPALSFARRSQSSTCLIQYLVYDTKPRPRPQSQTHQGTGVQIQVWNDAARSDAVASTIATSNSKHSDRIKVLARKSIDNVTEWTKGMWWAQFQRNLIVVCHGHDCEEVLDKN